MEKRIAELSRDKETGFVGWEFEGGEAVANEEACRLQLFFDEKPSEELLDGFLVQVQRSNLRAGLRIFSVTDSISSAVK